MSFKRKKQLLKRSCFFYTINTIERGKNMDTEKMLMELKNSVKTADKALQALRETLQKTEKKVSDLGDAFEEASGKLDTAGEGFEIFFDDILEKANEVTVFFEKKMAPAVENGMGSFARTSQDVESGAKAMWDYFDKMASQMERFKGEKAPLTQALSDFLPGASFAVGIIDGVAAIGGAIASAIEEMHETAIQNNLKEHFGSVVLSMEEIEHAAEALTTTDWTVKIDAIISSSEKAEEFKKDLETSLEEINQMNWKVKVGLQLTEEEQEGYRQTISNYVDSVIGYMEQNHYTATLTLETLFRPGSNNKQKLSEFVDQYYKDASGELNRWGSIMADRVNSALEDGILTEAEIDKIEEAISHLQEYARKEQQYEQEASLMIVEQETIGGGVTLDSFIEFVTRSNEAVKEKTETGKIELENGLKNLLKARDNGLSAEDYTSMLNEMIANHYTNEASMYAKVQQSGINAIKKEYSLNGNKKDILNEVLKSVKETNHYRENSSSFLEDFETVLDDKLKEMGGVNGSAIGELLTYLEPNTQELENLAAIYKNVGYIPVESISESLTDTYMLEGMAGNGTHMMQLLAWAIANDPSIRTSILEVAEQTRGLAPELSKVLQDEYGLEVVAEGSGYIWKVVGDVASMSAEEIQQKFSEIGLTLPDSLATSLADEDGKVVQGMLLLYDQIKNGAEVSAPQMKEVLSLLGIDATDGLVQSIMEQKPNIQMGVINMLYGMKDATDAEMFNILSSMHAYGIELPKSMVDGIKENYAVLNDEANHIAYIIDMSTGVAIKKITPNFGNYLTNMGITGFNSMDKVLQEKELRAMKMKEIDAQGYIDKTQRSFLGKVITVTAEVVKGASWLGLFGLGARANGGIVESPEIALIGEAGPESIIPLSRSRRSRALELYTQTSEALGVDEQITRAAVMSSVSGSRAAMAFLAAEAVTPESRVEINYRKLAQELYGALSASPIEVKPSFTVTGGDVYLDTMKAGKALAPHIDAELGKINHRRERGL